MWIIEPLELNAKDIHGNPRFRLTAYSDEDGGGPWALCSCPGAHASATEAMDCREAKTRSEMY